jgi:hypothetical protein
LRDDQRSLAIRARDFAAAMGGIHNDPLTAAGAGKSEIAHASFTG